MALLKRRFKRYGDPYDSWLFDYINGTKYPSATQWEELKSVIEEIQCFTKSKSRTRVKCELYRATDYEPVYTAQMGDVLDFTRRFYSWTDKLKVAKEIVGSFGGILILTGSDITGIDLRKINQMQSEVLLPPQKFVVVNVDNVDNISYITLKPVN